MEGRGSFFFQSAEEGSREKSLPVLRLRMSDIEVEESRSRNVPRQIDITLCTSETCDMPDRPLHVECHNIGGLNNWNRVWGI